MVLSPEQKIQALQAHYAHIPEWVIEARKNNKELLALVEGQGFRELLAKIEGLELSDKKFQARRNYSRSIKDLNERVLRPMENVFVATGGNKKFEIQNTKLAEKVMQSLRNIRGNKSLSKWMSTTWASAYVTDPNGLIFMEASKDGSKTYPTYKSIQGINYYQSKGQNVDFVVFSPCSYDYQGQKGQKVRIVDGESDESYFTMDGKEFILIEEDSFTHLYGECPAVIASDKEVIGSEVRLSILDRVTEIEKEYLRDQSILTLVKFLNGFKNLIRPKIICTSCHGQGKTGEQGCKGCGGTGWLVNRDVTDEIIIPIDLTNKEQTLPDATKVASYFGLDIETWNQYRGELKVLEVLIYEALWGTHLTSQENKTATAKFIDTQPVINRLNMISDCAEFVEQQIAEWVVRFTDPTLDRENYHVAINYGRRFIIDPPSALLDNYLEAREKGVSTVILDRIYFEYLTAKYRADEMELRKQLIKAKNEPYLHYTAEQVNTLFGRKESFKKVMFTKFWQENYEDNSSSLDNIESEFETYINNKYTELNESSNP